MTGPKQVHNYSRVNYEQTLCKVRQQVHSAERAIQLGYLLCTDSWLFELPKKRFFATTNPRIYHSAANIYQNICSTCLHPSGSNTKGGLILLNQLFRRSLTSNQILFKIIIINSPRINAETLLVNTKELYYIKIKPVCYYYYKPIIVSKYY